MEWFTGCTGLAEKCRIMGNVCAGFLGHVSYAHSGVVVTSWVVILDDDCSLDFSGCVFFCYEVSQNYFDIYMTDTAVLNPIMLIKVTQKEALLERMYFTGSKPMHTNNHSFKTCGGPEALASYTILKNMYNN